VKHNDCRSHQPNYCGDDCRVDTCCDRPGMPYRPRFWQGRRW
jgi:hypothetical protein